MSLYVINVACTDFIPLSLILRSLVTSECRRDFLVIAGTIVQSSI